MTSVEGHAGNAPGASPTALANTAASRALVSGLAAAGLVDVCISPGSRSTPLTVAFAEQNAIRPWLHIDERSSAYFALGLARASGRPVALVCTSGTAAANFFPAIVEASLSRVPLVVLTTDRPPLLRDVGAAQTVDQVRMYGSHVRLALDLPLPDATLPALRFGVFAARAVNAACGPLPGPVHLNVPFDEPLLAPPSHHPAPLDDGPAGALPAVRIPAPGAALMAACRALDGCRRPLIVAGPETGGLPATEIAMLARSLGAPILADPLSGLRTAPEAADHAIASYDAVLRDAGLAAGLRPDAVVHFGGPPTSKALNQMLGALAGLPYVLCDLPGGFRDPNGAVTHLLPGDPGFSAEALAAEVRTTAEPDWFARWRAVDRQASLAMQAEAMRFPELFEGRIFPELQQALPPEAVIVAGNSMPVRDLDSFLAAGGPVFTCVANRGANGIDGVTSSALGAAAAGKGPVVLVIGDLSFYHDMNGLWAAGRHGLNLIVVLVNNDGGGIFHFLPQAAHSGVFETWFGTPSGLDFRHAAELYGAAYKRVASWDAFREALRAGLAGGLHVIEVPTDRVRNVELHRMAWRAAAAAARSAEALQP